MKFKALNLGSTNSKMYQQTEEEFNARMTRSSLDLLEDVQGLDADAVWDRCINSLDALGVNSIFYGFVTSRAELERQKYTKSCHYKTNHSPEWLERFGEDSLLDDELTAQMIANDSKEVLWFDDSLWDDATPEQKDQTMLEDELGLSVGITVQLQGFSKLRTMSGIGLCTKLITKKEFPSYWEQHRAEVLGMSHVLDFNMRELHTVQFIKLTPRELEFLTMLASGYSQKQIAYKWKRSTNTLEHYSRSCKQKLKSANLEQAIFKSCVLGLINP